VAFGHSDQQIKHATRDQPEIAGVARDVARPALAPDAALIVWTTHRLELPAW
jgi:hypothetical protein